MYNYFMLLGRVSIINADCIEITTNKEALEVNVKTSKFPQLKSNMIVGVTGTIKAKGLYATKLYFPELDFKSIVVPEEVDQADEKTTQEEVETVTPVAEPKTIEEYAFDGQKWDLEKLLMLSLECEAYTIPMDKIDDIDCVAYLLKLNDKYYVIETTVARDDSHNQFFNAPYLTDKTHITDVEYKYLPRPKKLIAEETQDNYPENFKPLYQVGEKITIKYDYDRVVEDIIIEAIVPKLENDKIIDYYYDYRILTTNNETHKNGDVLRMSEKFLVDHEVLD